VSEDSVGDKARRGSLRMRNVGRPS